MAQYWVVGATFKWGDQYENFTEGGYWYCWDPRENKTVPKWSSERFKRIRIGDHIAIKKLVGGRSGKMLVRATGIVTEVDLKGWRVYVQWLITDTARLVPIGECMRSIHGPFQSDHPTVQSVFADIGGDKSLATQL